MDRGETGTRAGPQANRGGKVPAFQLHDESWVFRVWLI